MKLKKRWFWDWPPADGGPHRLQGSFLTSDLAMTEEQAKVKIEIQYFHGFPTVQYNRDDMRLWARIERRD